MADEGKGKIEKFNGMKFQWLKMQFEDYLYQNNLYLKLVEEKSESMNANKWTVTERLSLTPQVAFNISKEKTSDVVMQALEKLYEKSSSSNKVFLMKRLFNMRMSENGYVVDHINDFNDVTNQLESVSINFDDKIRALLFMCSLPDSSNNLVTTMSNPNISETLTLNDVVSSVMNDEMQRKMIGDGISSSTALSVKSRGEYHDGGFQEYYSNNGVRLIRTVKRTPQENGLAERMNRTIMERARNTGIHGTLELDEPEDGQVPKIENPEVLDETTDTEVRVGDLQQEDYIKNVLRRFNLHTSKPMTTPLAAHFKLSKELSPKTWEDEEYIAQVPYSSTVGSLMYAMVSTRLDIAHAVGLVSKFMTNSGKEHWQAVKWILIYLIGTSNFCLCFEGDNIDMQGHVNSDHAGD
ncbi:hypothetical protein RJ639_008784 [Escallonia herrerae]|uniref:Retrovirus-related Pol polyprotein from transposon TNT 1-94 n=1 Tax=Escallonia herrerae TaxID=1293975 RepID=A0AA88VTR1_9ASTE|nr:hypothetical protein RJ639_008784 [Escallonia herrerae]